MIKRNRRSKNFDSQTDPATDVAFGTLGYIVMLFFVAIIFMNPKPVDDDPKQKALEVTAIWDIGLPGRPISASKLTWRETLIAKAGAYVKPGHSKADVDLWLYYEDTEGRCQVVGFPGDLQSSAAFKLDKDDQGWGGVAVLDDVNEEIISSSISQLPAGKYEISLHLFSLKGEPSIDEAYPIVTELNITINKGMPGKKTWRFNVLLYEQDQELGVLFEIDEDGILVPGSFVPPSENNQIASHLEKRASCSGGGS